MANILEYGKTVALYCRISKMDDSKDYSVSIKGQIEILEKFAVENGFTKTKLYIDDGESGALFDRPGYLEMIEDIESGEVGTVVVKDHSRLGRDRLTIGYLLEVFFTEHQIRYMTADRKIDTATRGIPDELAFEDVFNEWHVKRTSEKIKQRNRQKIEDGISLRSRAPYGYMKDPNDKFHLIPNPETMDNVVLIFEMFASGAKIIDIVKELKERKILCPAAYHFQKYGKYRTNASHNDPYYWEYGTVRSILDNEVYIGTTVNGKSFKPSYKSKKKIRYSSEQWVRNFNTHEAIIDEALWNTVKQRRATKQRHNKSGEKDIFSGKLFCFDCGHIIHASAGYYMCGTYKRFLYHDNMGCTPHNISKKAVREIVLAAIQAVTHEAKNNKKAFIKVASSCSLRDVNKEIARLEKELKKAEIRLAELDRYLKSIYEDKVKGEITPEQFKFLLSQYTSEKTDKEKTADEINAQINEWKSKTFNTDEFLKIVDEYTEITELNQEIVNAFIDKIVVHERSEPHKRKGYTQEVDIYFNFIGKLR